MDQIGVALEPVRAALAQIGHFLPRLLLAVLILVAGWLLARFLRFAASKALKAINFGVLTERAGADAFLAQGGIKTDTTGIIVLLVYWLTVLVALMVAFNALGLAYVTDLIGRITLFVPRVIVAVLLLAFGGYFARFVGRAVTTYGRNIGVEHVELLGRVTVYAIMVFVVLIALDQVSIGTDIIRQSFLILLGGVVLALALAFGLAGRDLAREFLEGLRHRPKQREPDTLRHL
jgi:hypothetical protein